MIKTATLVALITLAMPATLAAQNPEPASAWARFEGRQIIASGASGIADRTTGRAVTTVDPVRVASISKVAVGLTVMRMVHAGTVDLDADVSRYLGWTLRHPAFPAEPITLRRLLSHTSGLRDAIDYVLPLDASLATAVADPKAWDNTNGPAVGYFTYSNLNFPIIAAVLEGASGERFDALANRHVFKPLGIEACFNWSGCSAESIARAVVLYRSTGEVARDDLAGKPPTCPGAPASDGSCDMTRYALARNGGAFSPQGGMRISALGLAKIGAVLAGRHPRFLSPRLLRIMTTPVWRYNGSNGAIEGGFYCAYGLAVSIIALPGSNPACRDDPFGDGKVRIGHGGDAYGLRSGLWVEPRSGKGIAFYATAVPADSPAGQRSAFTPAEEMMIDRAR